MAAPLVKTWPIPDAQAIAATQTLAGAGTLVLNGTLALNGSVTFPGFSRVVSLSSANNLSGVNFTVTGFINGVPISETRTGPNNNTVSTASIFDAITSVRASNAANAVSVGTGATGRTSWILSNIYAPFPAVGVQVIAGGTITWSFIVTLQDVSNQLTAAITPFSPVGGLTNQNGSTQGFYGEPFLYGAINVTASGADGTLTASILQQGPR